MPLAISKEPLLYPVRKKPRYQFSGCCEGLYSVSVTCRTSFLYFPYTIQISCVYFHYTNQQVHCVSFHGCTQNQAVCRPGYHFVLMIFTVVFLLRRPKVAWILYVCTPDEKTSSFPEPKGGPSGVEGGAVYYLKSLSLLKMISTQTFPSYW